MKALFVYPNFETSLRIPLALAIFSAILKERGHEALIFDPTFMSSRYDADFRLMESREVVKRTKLEQVIGDLPEKDILEELDCAIKQFRPDIIAFSLLERNYHTFKRLLKHIKRMCPETPILVGGILPSIYPRLLVEDPEVDWVCVGEGESLIANLADLWPDREAIQRLPNLWCRRNGQIVKNPLAPLEDMEKVPDQDWQEFDARHLYKPFEGKVYVGGSFEWSRGCMNRCSFCVGPALREVYQARGPQYHRTKSVNKIINEIETKTQQYGLTLNAFCDTNFLQGIPKPMLADFCRQYQRKVGVPFIMQTSAESITEDKLLMLMDAGCVTASIGVESGSQRMRQNVLKKGPTKDRIRRCFDLCRRHDFRLTANYMIGLPFETEEDVVDTIQFNRELNPPSIAIHYFTPFLGTALYDLALKEGFYKGFDPKASVYKTSPLTMPQLSQERIEELVQYFTEDFNGWKQEIIPEIPETFAVA